MSTSFWQHFTSFLHQFIIGLAAFWHVFVVISAACWRDFNIILASGCHSTGTLSTPFCHDSSIILASVYHQSGIISTSLWYHSNSTLAPFQHNSGGPSVLYGTSVIDALLIAAAGEICHPTVCARHALLRCSKTNTTTSQNKKRFHLAKNMRHTTCSMDKKFKGS